MRIFQKNNTNDRLKASLNEIEKDLVSVYLCRPFFGCRCVVSCCCKQDRPPFDCQVLNLKERERKRVL